MSPWQTGLCSCCASPGGVQVCCLACCCPGVVYALTIEKMSRPYDCPLGGSCVGAGVVWNGLACAGLCCVAQCLGRVAIREKREIEGGLLTDWLTIMCCSCCALIQVPDYFAAVRGTHTDPIPHRNTTRCIRRRSEWPQTT